jgi:dihydroorotate dehydrogenase electron transfer subunit
VTTLAPRQQFIASVKQNSAICREHFRLTLTLSSFPPTEPGQFIQILCRDVDVPENEIEFSWQPGERGELHDREFLAPLALLRRPFSLAGRADKSDGTELEIIHRVVGIGTDWLGKLKIGDGVSILGPLGNRFQFPPKNHTALLVGGGVGIPPMLYLAQKLADQNAIAFCGATTKDLLALTIAADPDRAGVTPNFSIAEFAQHNIPAIITTDDASYGMGGYVTQALEKWLDTNSNTAITIYTCGPEPMMKRVAEIAINRNIPCQVAVERAMACGMGTCQSCVIRVRKNDSWLYKLACTDGPIFNAADLLW